MSMIKDIWRSYNMSKKILGKNINWAVPSQPIENVVLEIKNLPTFMGCVEPEYDIKDDYFADLMFGVCPISGTIQSMNRLPLDKIYIRPHNACVGKVWRDHNDAFAKFILDRLPKNAVVYEIGSGDGMLASVCIDHVKEWHSIEPNLPDSYFTHDKLTYHTEGYYPDVKIKNADVVVHSNLLEHIGDPIDFLINMEAPMQMFSVPNFNFGMRIGNPSILNFEHENALQEELLDDICQSAGYSTFCVNYNNFTMFYEIHKVKEKKELKPFDYNKSLELLTVYKIELESQATTLENKIKSILHPDDKIFFFGAHIFYTCLRSLGLHSKFTGIIDNSPLKINKRLYGTSYIVQHPDIIKDINTPIIIVPRTPYKDEMIEQIKLLNGGAKIISHE